MAAPFPAIIAVFWSGSSALREVQMTSPLSCPAADDLEPLVPHHRRACSGEPGVFGSNDGPGSRFAVWWWLVPHADMLLTKLMIAT
jgi:hypothetical protein